MPGPAATVDAGLLRHLTVTDVARLAGDPSAGTRERTACKLAAEFAQGLTGERERRLAAEIFHILARDVECRVRRSLSMALKDCPYIPLDLAFTMARDVADVARPIITSCEVLTDDLLIEIVESDGTDKQLAVAERRRLSSRVTTALIATEKEVVVEAVVQNDGAEIAERAWHKVIDDFTSNEAILAAVVERQALPLGVVERLAATVSRTLQRRLIETYGLKNQLAYTLVAESRATTLERFSADEEVDGETRAFVRRLKSEKRLSAAFLLKALFSHDLVLFEAAMASLANVPIDYARYQIRRKGFDGLRLLYQRSGLPAHYLNAFAVGVEAARKAGAPGAGFDPALHRQAIADGLSQAYGDRGRDRMLRTLLHLKQSLPTPRRSSAALTHVAAHPEFPPARTGLFPAIAAPG